MSDTKPDGPNYRHLRLIRLVAISDGLLACALAYFLMTGFNEYDWLMAVISFVVGATVHGAVVYSGCMIFAPDLAGYVVSDDTKIGGSNVEMVTTVRDSGDERIDAWVRYYVNARNLFGMSILPLVLLAGLFWFG